MTSCRPFELLWKRNLTPSEPRQDDPEIVNENRSTLSFLRSSWSCVALWHRVDLHQASLLRFAVADGLPLGGHGRTAPTGGENVPGRSWEIC